MGLPYQFDVVCFKANTFSVITQNNGHFAVQGYSRLRNLVPIESPYATLAPIQVTADYWANFPRRRGYTQAAAANHARTAGPTKLSMSCLKRSVTFG